MKRINPLTNISDSDVEKKINDLEKYFHFTTKDSIVKNYFSQTDSTSTIELFSLIDAIEHCNCIDSDWVKKNIDIIEKKNINNAYGSLWEILFGGILFDSGVNVTLEKDSNQGIDLSANIWGTDFHFSLKRYEPSTHYNNLELFFEKLKPIIEQFREEITNTFIYFQTYPDSTILSNVEKKLKKELQTSNKTNTITNHINEPGQYLIIINHNKKQYKKIRLCPEIKWLCLSINQLCMNNLEKFFEEVYKESHFKEISSAQFADILRKYVFNRMPVDNENAGLAAMDKMVTQIHNKHSLIQN